MLPNKIGVRIEKTKITFKCQATSGKQKLLVIK